MANSPIKYTPNQAVIGLNLENIISQVRPGMVTWATNAIKEGFDGNTLTYQNEQANEHCIDFPTGYKVIGKLNIIQKGFTLVWLANPSTGDSELGKIINGECKYERIINDPCLGFSIDHPIHKAVAKVTNCSTEIYWPQTNKGRMWIDLDNLPFKEDRSNGDCDVIITEEIDCNKLLVQPNFSIPQIELTEVDNDGDNKAGTYQFAVQYSNALGEGYTAFYSVTNPLPLFDPNKITQDFNYSVGKSIKIEISHLDTTGYYDFFNLAVIKTVNNITSVELVGTYEINDDIKTIIYTGQNKEQIRLSIDDIFQKFPIYEGAGDLTTAQDVLIWDDLTTQEQISYQKIANQISLQWQTWRVNGNKAYANEINATYLKGYMRDEIYPYEVVFLLKNGWQTDGFHIPSRVAQPEDLVPIANDDVLPDRIADDCSIPTPAKPTWQVYNTGCISGYEQNYLNFIAGDPNTCIECLPPENPTPNDPKCYVGPFQYGCFAYWESTDIYPCNEDVWGELAGKPIRHHKFPDSLITHIHDNEGFIYPIGIKVDVQQIRDLIKNSSLTEEQKSRIAGFKIVRGNRANNKSIIAKGIIHNVGKYTIDEQTYFFPNFLYNDRRADPFLCPTEGRNTKLDAFSTDDSRKRWTFHSPDTSFYQPYLGNILKLETAEFGQSKGKFYEVLDHAKYKFPSLESYIVSVVVAATVAALGTGVGDGLDWAGGAVMFQALNEIMYRLIPNRNMCQQYNSIGEYTNFKAIDNNGKKQRFIDLGVYLNPGNFGVGDIYNVNNFQRESSVYLRATTTLPFTDEVLGVPPDESKWVPSNSDECSFKGFRFKNISSYYSSVKRNFDNQYGQLYSYETIDTGFQFLFDGDRNYSDSERWKSVFGGDIFINRFAYKSKIPFFIDNRVGSPDNSDVFYDELSNVAFTRYWFSTDIERGTGGVVNLIGSLFGVKDNNFNCSDDKFFYDSGKIYLFAYGIPYFFCESEVNVDLRQAFNDKEGDFFPRVSSDIPNDWLQEKNVSILQDNTYYYNKTYSKQNKENEFSHLPEDFDPTKTCKYVFPYRAIFSEQQQQNETRNSWLIYKPASVYDFPQNYGSLVSLEGIENRVVLARFENKSLLYNALLTAPTSAAQVYLGQTLFSQQVPPLDFADTDLGFAGTQHKLFLKTEYGHVSTDAKRGQVFLFNGQQASEISNEYVNKFLTNYLDFEIKKAFPTFPIDNHFKGVGLHGVYDSKYNRFLITKLDYAPTEGVVYEDGKFLFAQKEIKLGDPDYFCNRSFTISYDFDDKMWVSLHTYLPNYYIGEANYFFSGVNGIGYSSHDNNPSLWRHNTSLKFNNFYGKIHPYILEYPFAYKYNDEILQGIKDYTKCYQYSDIQTFIEVDDVYFNKAICYNNQQSSGILKLVKKPQHNLSAYQKYPIYHADSKEILYTKSDNFYNFNTMWGLTKNPRTPLWTKSCSSISLFKELNQSNCDYSKRSFKKEPIRAKDLRVRLILDDRDDTKIVSQFIIQQSQESFK